MATPQIFSPSLEDMLIGLLRDAEEHEVNALLNASHEFGAYRFIIGKIHGLRICRELIAEAKRKIQET